MTIEQASRPGISTLAPLLNPRSVGIVGASQRFSRGTRMLRNLLSVGFPGQVYPINPKYDEIDGLPCYPSVRETPEPVDSLVVAIPAPQVIELLEDALGAGVRAAIVLSSGFAEAGEPGRERHRGLESLAERGLLICGPNCYGLFNVTARACTFGGHIPDPLIAGNVGLISQSGGFSNLIANPLMEFRGVGFSYIVSCGNQAGVSLEDYMEYMVEDDDTQVIAVFAESFRRPGKLRAVAARAAERGKAIVVLKVGRSETAQRATQAHTGALAASSDIMNAILQQSGIIQVNTLNEMMETICLLASAGGRTSGRRLGVLTGSGGECSYVSEAADAAGLELAELAPSSLEAVKEILPDFAAPRNPLDGTGAMYETDRIFPRLLRTFLDDPNLDVVALNMGANIPKPGAITFSRPYAKIIAEAAPESDRLIVAYASTIGGALDQEVIEPLRAVGIPFLEGAETAMLAIAHLNEHREYLARCGAGSLQQAAGTPLVAPLASGLLSFMEARTLLDQVGIPTVATRLATTPEEAVAAAETLGYPVVLKVESAQVAHKSDVGGVKLGCMDAAAVREAYAEILTNVTRAMSDAQIDGVLVQPMVSGGVETIVGVKSDAHLGSAVLFGLGGIFAEVLRDVTLRVPPLTEADASEMVREIRSSAIFYGARGRPPADLEALTGVILGVGRLVEALGPRLLALDLNPLLVQPAGQGVLALDALIELGSPES